MKPSLDMQNSTVIHLVYVPLLQLVGSFMWITRHADLTIMQHDVNMVLILFSFN